MCASECMVTTGYSESEVLPSNQEACSCEAPVVIDNRVLFDMIQSGFKTTEGRFNTIDGRIEALEKCFAVIEERMDTLCL